MRKRHFNRQMAGPLGVFCTAAVIYAVCLCACGSSTTTTVIQNNAKSGGNVTLYTLTITNQLAWCNVTASIDGNQVAQFGNDSATVQAAAKATVNLTASPQPGYQDPVWTGTTSTTDPTTYVMNSDANQTINVYCD